MEVANNGLQLDFKTSTSCDTPPPPPAQGEIYASLKKKLDGGYALSDDGKIRITYIEKYATAPGQTVTWKIYDNITQQPDHMGYVPNNYGVNWHEIDLPGLTDDEYYILEISGANKGETYYLRFKY